jgi:hypothetical protein
MKSLLKQSFFFADFKNVVGNSMKQDSTSMPLFPLLGASHSHSKLALRAMLDMSLGMAAGRPSFVKASLPGFFTTAAPTYNTLAEIS